MRISDWSSDVCSSDLGCIYQPLMVSPDFTATRTFLPSLVSQRTRVALPDLGSATATLLTASGASLCSRPPCGSRWFGFLVRVFVLTAATTTLPSFGRLCVPSPVRSEEHTSELHFLKP